MSAARDAGGDPGPRAHCLVAEQYRVLNDVLLPALAQQGIQLLKRKDWSERQARWIKRYFRSEVLPVLTPIGLDPAHPFPRVQNKSLNFVVSVRGSDAFGRSSGVGDRAGAALAAARAAAPRPRWRAARTTSSCSPRSSTSTSAEVFPGMEVAGCYQFRVTRNSDLWVDEEEVDDLMRALKGELTSRNYGDAVRLEVADTCTEEIAELLLGLLQLEKQDLYRVHGPVNLHRLSAIYDRTDRPDLKFPPFLPGLPQRIDGKQDMFAALRERRRPAAPPLRVLRPGAGPPAPGGGGPRRAGDQADALPHRLGLAGRGGADRRGARRQGGHRR